MLQRKLTQFLPTIPARLSSSTVSANDNIATTLENRNPRNLERMRLGYKPNGYALDVRGKKFWHKIEIIPTNRHITARVIHFANGTVVEASSSEWAVKKQLFKPTDTCAYINVGRILAHRCIRSGITEVRCDIKPVEGGKVEQLLKHVESGGVCLEESRRYRNPEVWETYRAEKPWEILEENV